MENQARTGTRPRRGLNDAQRTVYFSFFAYGTRLATRVWLPPGNRAGEGVLRNGARLHYLRPRDIGSAVSGTPRSPRPYERAT